MTATNGVSKAKAPELDVPKWIVQRDDNFVLRGTSFHVECVDGVWVDAFGTPVTEEMTSQHERSKAVSPKSPADTGPLDGLRQLSSVALVGRSAIVAAASRAIVWLWDSYVCAGQVVLIFGAPGEGKTTLLFMLAVARANATAIDVLGRSVEPAPANKYVVIIEGEHDEGSASRKLLKTEEILGADEHALDRIILIARKEVRIGTARWAEVKALIARGHVSDLFVDSLARLASGDANSEQEQVEVFAEIGEALESAPKDGDVPTCWMNAHGRKNATGGVDDVSGSAQRAAQSDTILFVKATKDEDDKVISSRVSATKLREEPDEWPKAVEFSIAKNDAGKWQCSVGGASARPQDTPAHERIYAILESAKTKNEIKEALKLNSDRLEKALTVLFTEKRIKKVKKTVGGRERDAFARKQQSHFDFPSANRRGTRRAAPSSAAPEGT